MATDLLRLNPHLRFRSQPKGEEHRSEESEVANTRHRDDRQEEGHLFRQVRNVPEIELTDSALLVLKFPESREIALPPEALS
jgi:hypothetical protein